MPAKPPLSVQTPDLPEELEPAGRIESLDQLSLECALIESVRLPGTQASELRIEQCRLTRVELTGAELIRALVADSVVQGGSWANVRTNDLRLRRVAFEGVRMTGAGLSSAALEDVSFVDCRFDLAFLASARLNRVLFRRCQLDEADFSGASLTSVTFDDCTLTRARWTDCVVVQSEMRGCDLSGAIDLARLHGLRMPFDDVLANAAELAASLGIQIVD